MEKLEEESRAKFINALIKSVQTLCHGYLDFNNGIEIIGHINLSVDKGSSMHYILEEKVCKGEENSTLFISNSFHAQNQKDKSKGRDSDVPSRSKTEDATSASVLGEDGKLSAISSISSALSKSHEKNRSGSASSAKDSENSHSRPQSSTAKRKASDDHNNDVRAAKMSQLGSSPSPVSHFLSQSPHGPSGSSSPVDTKPSMRQMHGEDSSGTVLPQTAAVTSDGAGDLSVNLVGSVLERVDDQHSNSDFQDRGDDSDGDLEVTFIKEEYVEGEQAACQFDNSGGQQYGRGSHQRASSSDMSDGSMYPMPLHHSQSASSTFVPSAAQHYAPSTSSQPQPGTSGMRGNLNQNEPPQPVPEGMKPGCGYAHPSDAQKWMTEVLKRRMRRWRKAVEERCWTEPPCVASIHPTTTTITTTLQPLSLVKREQPVFPERSSSATSSTSTDTITRTPSNDFVGRGPPKDFLGKTPLENLAERRERKKASPATCEKCGLTLSSRQSLASHRYKIHLRQQVFDCSLCGRRYSSQRYLTNHMFNEHRGLGGSSGESTTVDCALCGESFPNQRCLDKHVIKEHDETK